MSPRRRWVALAALALRALQPGKFTDLVVLDRDYLTVPVEQIKDIRSVMTMVGGRVVYEH